MTLKQKKWADYFLECGNKTEAAIKAGYSKKSAVCIGYENQTKPYIAEYLEKKQKEMASVRVADMREVLEFYTKVMRGEQKDQFDLDAALSDRLDAAKQLGKRYGLDKLAIVGGDKDDNPVKTSQVEVYIPDNKRGDADAD